MHSGVPSKCDLRMVTKGTAAPVVLDPFRAHHAFVVPADIKKTPLHGYQQIKLVREQVGHSDEGIISTGSRQLSLVCWWVG